MTNKTESGVMGKPEQGPARGSGTGAARSVQITIDAQDPRSLSMFWAQALHYVVPPPPGSDPDVPDPLAAWDEFLAGLGVPEFQWNSNSAAHDPAGVGPRLFFQRAQGPKVGKNRVHLDVRAAPGLDGEERMAALEAEHDRLVALGARRLRRVEPELPLDPGHIVMADPEGNEFCLD